MKLAKSPDPLNGRLEKRPNFTAQRNDAICHQWPTVVAIKAAAFEIALMLSGGDIIIKLPRRRFMRLEARAAVLPTNF